MPARPDSQSTTRSAPLTCAALLCAGQLIVTFPGRLVVDSTQQLSQALSHRYGDWHPPVMAFVWSLLIRITGSSGALLVLHQVLHWLGILGKWSMLDVFVVAILIVLVKIGPLAKVEAQRGLYWFAGAILLSMITSMYVDSLAGKKE